MLSHLRAILAILLVLFGLALPAIAPELANVGVIMVAMLGVFLVNRAPIRSLVRQPAVAMPAVAVGTLVLSQLFTAKAAPDLFPVLAVAPVLLILPIALLLMALPRPAEAVHGAALAGVAAATGLAAYDVHVTTLGRGGMSVANPIHFADVCIVLGIVAASGVAQVGLRVRWVFLVAPVLVAVAVLLSGSRGPMLALPGIAVAFVLASFLVYLPRRSAITLCVVVVALGVLAAMGLLHGGQLSGLPGIGEIQNVLSGAAPSPGSVGERMAMYQGGLKAFFESPWVGYGLANYFAVATRDVPGGLLGSYDHLHSDVADFAVAGGMLGLAAYGMLIMAPVVQAIAARRQPVAVLLGCGLAAGYLLMGLTNAVIGIVTLTILYAFGLAIQLRFSITPIPVHNTPSH